jgi:diketogulonate reductase-like aldo/keto reductase
MAELRDDGLIRHTGVSNFRTWRLKRARETSPVPPLADQVRVHPHYTHRKLRSYCRREDLLVIAYSPLAHGGMIDDDVLAAIGEGYGKSAAQVALRWAIERENVLPIPKATSRDHLAANADVFDFELTEDEHDRITRPSIAKSIRHFLRNEVGL